MLSTVKLTSHPSNVFHYTNSLVADVPSPPKGPLKILRVTEDSAELEWGPSEHDGGTPILQYSIEIRESRRTTWGRAGVVDAKNTRYISRNLVINNEYSFRIRAINAEGESLPLDGDECVIPRRKTGEWAFSGLSVVSVFLNTVELQGQTRTHTSLKAYMVL